MGAFRRSVILWLRHCSCCCMLLLLLYASIAIACCYGYRSCHCFCCYGHCVLLLLLYAAAAEQNKDMHSTIFANLSRLASISCGDVGLQICKICSVSCELVASYISCKWVFLSSQVLHTKSVLSFLACTSGMAIGNPWQSQLRREWLNSVRVLLPLPPSLFCPFLGDFFSSSEMLCSQSHMLPSFGVRASMHVCASMHVGTRKFVYTHSISSWF